MCVYVYLFISESVLQQKSQIYRQTNRYTDTRDTEQIKVGHNNH